MTDTPEMTEWLNRIILGTDNTPGHGERQTFKSLSGGIGEARALLYGDLHYDITRKQFEGLVEAKNEAFPLKEEQIRYKEIKHGKLTGIVWYRQVFRDVWGHFAKRS